MTYDRLAIQACKRALLDMALAVDARVPDCPGCGSNKRVEARALRRAAAQLSDRVNGVRLEPQAKPPRRLP